METCSGPVGVVGGGHIGVEMAEAIAANGFEVHLFQRGDRILKQFGEATSEAVLEHLGEQNVAVNLGAEVRELAGDGTVEAVVTDDDRETNVEDVYAAGDCAEATHVVTGERTYVPLALTANRHGRAIGKTIAGAPTEGGGVAGTAAVKAFDVEAARTGVLDHEVATEPGSNR